MSNQLLTVATFNFTTDPAFLLFKAALKHHGISYFAADEHTVNADPLLSIVVGGIRVMVHEDDVPKAIGILREIREAEAPQDLPGENFGEHAFILDDIPIQKINTSQSENAGQFSAYPILVAVLTGLLILILLIITFLAV